jgi:outer membrane protein assembly factor BamB
MNSAKSTTGVIVGCVMLLGASGVCAQDWPQWRGPHRDGRATGFTAPKTWPKEPTQKWKVPVGQGVASPALVGDKLYVFAQDGGSEVLRCLEAASGKELWQEKYDSAKVSGIAAGRGGEFSGPRASPTVADGKVVTLGSRGTLSCYDAASGKKLWRKDDFKASLPRFFTASSPIVVDGLCIAQLGGESKGALVAYDLKTGDEKWKWTGDGSAYASPVVLTVDGAKVIVAETANNIVGVAVADGKLLWKTSFAATGAGRSYNACTPMVDGQTVIFSGSGRGTRAVKIEKKDADVAAIDAWKNPDNGVQFSTPVIKDGFVYGLSANDTLFCVNAKDGKTAWTSSISGKRGYGSIVDAGPVLMALTPSAQLIVFEPSDKEFKKVMSYKVSDKETYAYPVVSGNRIFVKDADSLTLYTIE